MQMTLEVDKSLYDELLKFGGNVNEAIKSYLKEKKKQEELSRIKAEIQESFDDIKAGRVEYICTKEIKL